ncbi:MAG: hypothetical protein KGS45_03640 [Planctomycetes bacterium]|nr:hypothetical protein [Planctomycetota bacterium]
MKHLVIQTEHLDPECAAWLGERCELVQCGVDDARAADLLARASGLVVRTYTQVNAALLDRCPQVKVVARGGVGLDNIDVAECRRRCIKVVYTPEANVQAVTEYVIALMMDAVRPRIDLAAPVSQQEWNTLRRTYVGRKQISELVFGIYGFGRIGRRVARVLAAIGAHVMYHDLLSMPPDWRSTARPVLREELLAQSDVITLHVDGRDENRHLIDGFALGRMKSDVTLINTSRGTVIDPVALSRFLKEHPNARATLDVHDPEPIESGSPLLGLPNVRLLPHLASCTLSAQREMAWVVRDVWRVLNNEVPEFEPPEA